jgi:NAD(P)H-hydrate epimerase
MSRLVFPPRAATLHKGEAGRLLIIAGSERYPGAPLLAARAALRGGAGLVTLGIPVTIAGALAGRLPEATLLPLPVDGDGRIDFVAGAELILTEPADALVVGPGLPPETATAALCSQLAHVEGPPMVIDAGALRAFADDPDFLPTQPARELLLTPHVGEFLALSRGRSADTPAVAALAARLDVIIVCKGSTTLIADPDGRIERRGEPNPLLATGGTGDTLAGLLGALLAAGMEPFEAALLAVDWHAAAGTRLARRLGRAGLLASELADELPLVRREIEDPAN